MCSRAGQRWREIRLNWNSYGLDRNQQPRAEAPCHLSLSLFACLHGSSLPWDEPCRVLCLPALRPALPTSWTSSWINHRHGATCCCFLRKEHNLKVCPLLPWCSPSTLPDHRVSDTTGLEVLQANWGAESQQTWFFALVLLLTFWGLGLISVWSLRKQHGLNLWLCFPHLSYQAVLCNSQEYGLWIQTA